MSNSPNKGQRLLSDNPALERHGWLPDGVWELTDRLRAEHTALLDKRVAAAEEIHALRKQFDAEDEGRIDAYREDGSAKVTPEPQRKAQLDEASAKWDAAQRNLAEFLARAVAEIQAHESELEGELRAKNREAKAKREEAQRLFDEADREVRALVPAKNWLDKTVKNTAGRHHPFSDMAPPGPRTELNLAQTRGLAPEEVAGDPLDPPQGEQTDHNNDAALQEATF